MQTLGPVFNTNRMIEEYTKKFYIPSALEHARLKKDDFALAKKKAVWLKNLMNNWDGIKIISSEDNAKNEVRITNDMTVQSKIFLGDISPEDISVQIYSGYLDSMHRISEASIDEMRLVSKEGGNYIYEGKVRTDKVGHCGYTVRVMPHYGGEVQYLPGLIKWQQNI